MTQTTKIALLSSAFLGALLSTVYAEAAPPSTASSSSGAATTSATSTGTDATASVTAPADSATPPTLKINGFTLFNTYVVNQSNRTNGKGGAPIHFATDVSDLYFTIAGKAYSATSGPIDYMYRVNIQAFPNSSPTVDQNYIQIKTDYYGFRMGSTKGPENFVIQDASAIIGGAGGFDAASYANVYNLSAGVCKGNNVIMDTGKAAKFIFMGPSYMGFQFFASYTPNTAKGGDAEKDNIFPDNPAIPGNSKGIYPTKAAQPFGINNWVLALSYKAAVGLWSFNVNGAAVTESSYFTVLSGALPINRFKLRSGWAYQLGGLVGYDKWQVALGYLNSGKARLPRIQDMSLGKGVTTGNMHLGNSGQAWNAGLGYTVGAYEFAGSYQHFWRKTDGTNRATNDVWTGTVDFNVFQGWKMYFELDYVRSKTSQTAVAFANAVNGVFSSRLVQGVGNNSGVIGILGTKISF